MTASRRHFLQGAVAGGAAIGLIRRLEEQYLALGLSWPERESQPQAAGSAISLWVRILPDETVHLTFHRTEMGQGAITALAMIVAEELDADWSRVRCVQASNDARLGGQDTGGSASVRDGFAPLRRAGAIARAMLVTAAAARWGSDAGTLSTASGAVRHPDGRRLSYGALAAEAALLPVPGDVPLKAESGFRIVGTNVARVDGREKSRGLATFGHDVRLPGMLRAAIRRCPYHGGKVAEVDESAAARIPGFVRTVRLTRPWEGVAVLVDGSSWHALRAAEALRVRWELPLAVDDSASLERKLESALSAGWNGTAQPAAISVRDTRGPTPPATTFDATYRTPFAPHLQMEPLTATARPDGDGVEIWAPSQVPQWGAMQVSGATGVPMNRIRIHPTMLGGGFGRRLLADTLSEAALLARAAGRAVQLVGTRADDLGSDFFRPPSIQQVRAALAADGSVAHWDQVLAGPSIDWSRGMRMPTRVPEDIGQGYETNVGPYRLPSVRQRWVPVETGIRLGWWRSVGHGVNAFPVEVAIDELAHLAGRDPLEYRLAHLAHAPRAQAVLRLAAARARWTERRTDGRGRGIAVWDTFGTVVAMVVEASVTPGARVRVHRVTCAVDCGRVVHPDGARAQIEGGVIFALSSALYEALTFRENAVQQRGFEDYAIVRFADAPVIDVHFIESTAAPTGTGEGGVPPVAPAVSNAVFAATGQRLRSIPFRAG